MIMSDNDSKIGCWSIILALFLLGAIISGVQTCRRNVRSHNEVLIPINKTFRCDDNENYDYIKITYKGKGHGVIFPYSESVRAVFLYFEIRNGDELYDSGGEYFGYIKVLQDGSFKIKDSDLFNGHYYGESGAKARINNTKGGKYGNFDVELKDVTVIEVPDRNGNNVVYDDLLGDWYYADITNNDTVCLEILRYIKVTKDDKGDMIYKSQNASYSYIDGLKYDESNGNIIVNTDRRVMELKSGYWDGYYIEFGDIKNAVVNVRKNDTLIIVKKCLIPKFIHINKLVEEHDMGTMHY